MRYFCLEKFIRGWIVGDFNPNVIKTKNFEFGIKKYQKGDIEQSHLHKKSEEITVIISGLFKMNGKMLKKGDIVLVEKNEAADFACLKGGYTAVVKIPSVRNDKYLCY